MLWESEFDFTDHYEGWCVSKRCKFTKFCIFKIYRNFVCRSILQTRSIANIKWRKNVHHLCIWKWLLPWWKGFCKVHLWICNFRPRWSFYFEKWLRKICESCRKVCPTFILVVTHWKPEQSITIAKENDDESGWIGDEEDRMLSWWDKKNVVWWAY